MHTALRQLTERVLEDMSNSRQPRAILFKYEPRCELSINAAKTGYRGKVEGRGEGGGETIEWK